MSRGGVDEGVSRRAGLLCVLVRFFFFVFFSCLCVGLFKFEMCYMGILKKDWNGSLGYW